MSCSWDLHCPEHKAWAGLDWNRGDEAIALLWRNRDRLLELWKLVHEEEVFDLEEIRLARNYEKLTSEHIAFLLDHGDHHLELVSEYRDRKDVATMERLPPRHCATCTCPSR